MLKKPGGRGYIPVIRRYVEQAKLTAGGRGKLTSGSAAMQTNTGAPRAVAPVDPVPSDLGHAGAVVDKAIAHMMGQQIDAISIASALLGGSLGLLARTLSDEAILRVLDQAAAAVRSGDLRRSDEDAMPETMPAERRAQA